jgi:hypothetical protein
LEGLEEVAELLIGGGQLVAAGGEQFGGAACEGYE